MDPSFEIRRTDQQAIRLEINLEPKQDFWVLFSSDRHHDNAKCDHGMEKRHLDQAKERGAAILDFGDLFCAMQGKWDPRSSMKEMRPELRVDDYLNALVDYNADFYRPYARNFALFSVGNHEDAIAKKNGFDLTKALIEELTADGCQAARGTYHGWVQFHFRYHKTNSASYKLRYTHGYAGGGQVTKDMIQANRQLVYTELCDFLVSGHTHDQWYLPIERHYLSDEGKVIYHKTHCIKIGGYKNEHECGGGWAATKGHPPRPLGAWWVRFYCERGRIRGEVINTE